MYRRGPTKATPANVQCQKCLKRGHYSYECKASAQERPYVPRPSRTQQLLNPKLMPKLQSDTAEMLQPKKGLADEQLAKREADRARQQALERDDDDDESRTNAPKRGRSASYDSVSTISTREPASPRGSTSPRLRSSREEQSLSPPRGYHRRPSVHSRSDHERRDSPNRKRHGRRASLDSTSDRSGRYSPSPERTHNRQQRSLSRRQTSSPSYDSSPRQRRFNSRDLPPDPRGASRSYRSRDTDAARGSRSPAPDKWHRDLHRDFRSRSPRPARGHESSSPRYSERTGGQGGAWQSRAPRQEAARQRSLSPFSKRLALTQAMNAKR
ncbi:zinc knuckle-domain-containing protein [Xylariaceae sp. FL1272]|nr:zinc knuckle-domain-containing protein [Xylariaceae sp. FL1272]